MRALVVSKITSWTHYNRNTGMRDDRLRMHLQKRGIESAALENAHQEHHLTLKKTLAILDDLGVDVHECMTDSLPRKKKWDVIIAVGGDGTILATSHMIQDDTPLFGINSDERRSKGSLAYCTNKGLRQHLQALVRGRLTPQIARRIEVCISGLPPLPYALNDVYVSGIYPQDTVKYDISVDSKRWVRHMGSGLLACTGTGSTAWMQNMLRLWPEDLATILKMLHVRKSSRRCSDLADSYTASLQFSKDTQFMRYHAMDLIMGPQSAKEYRDGFARRIELRSCMYDGQISIDGRVRADFAHGKRVVLSIDAPPLHIYSKS